MFVKQISVYLENVRGALRELTALLAEKNVNLLALSIADTAGFGIVRIIVASPTWILRWTRCAARGISPKSTTSSACVRRTARAGCPACWR
jgi:hypothetical protein